MKPGDMVVVTTPNHPLCQKGTFVKLVSRDIDGWMVEFGELDIFYVASEHLDPEDIFDTEDAIYIVKYRLGS